MALPKFDFNLDIWIEERVEEAVLAHGLTHTAHWALKQVANTQRDHGPEFVRHLYDRFEDELMCLSNGDLT